MNPMQRRIELRRKRKEAKERTIKYILTFFLVMTLFLLYGIWPRNGNSLANPFELETITSSQKMTEESVHIYPLGCSSDSSERIVTSSEVVEDEYVYDITEQERELLLKLAFCEANTESIECQMAAIQVVFNRTASDAFPDNIHDVLYADYQFSPVGTSWFDNAEYNDKNVEALERVLKGEEIVSENVVFFWSTAIDVNEPGTWYYNMHQNKFCVQIDNTLFYYE